MKSAYAISAVAALALGVGTAAAQQATTFDFFADQNLENDVAYEDFNKAMEEGGMYEEWDANDDDTVDREEFNRGVWSRYDVNDDDVLDENERAAAGDEDFFGLGD